MLLTRRIISATIKLNVTPEEFAYIKERERNSAQAAATVLAEKRGLLETCDDGCCTNVFETECSEMSNGDWLIEHSISNFKDDIS